MLNIYKNRNISKLKKLEDFDVIFIISDNVVPLIL